LCVTSGTAALEVALKAVGVEDKEVIIPSNTFFATSVAARNAGAKIQLTDIENETFSMCPRSLERCITKNTKAVVVVHIGGMVSSRIGEIVDICKSRSLYLIEDAAHAHGSRSNEYVAGCIGDIACFSFFPTKVMTTGEGGMIATNNDRLFELCKSLKNFGRSNQDVAICVNDFGNNFKVSEFTSLMGLLELDRVKERINRRKTLAKIYADELTGMYNVCYDAQSSFYKVIVKTHKDLDYHTYCKNKGVRLTGEVYKTPIHEQPLYYNQFDPKDFPITNSFSKSHICPPLYPELTDDQVKYTCEVLKECYENKGR
jgi:dTDP-4-amino-4,6-dideoxygalactose transaminase